MSDYEAIRTEAPPALEDFPSIEDTGAVIRQVNRLFDPYVFFERHKDSMGDYLIRCAVSANEIIREGKNLQHCVGGYAQRHMSGALTICFLRRRDAPHKSLYTIEMQGNRLMQIHGFQNDRNAANPRTTMAWMIKPWLDWIAKGSKRDKDGKPRLPKKKEAKTA